MITAETVTDEEIHGLLITLKAEAQCECGCGPLPDPVTRNDMRACLAATATEIVVSEWTREAARARCAEILNARSAK